MAGPLRNKQGCWTCRLRKKKCDECRPQCSNCQNLLITCYGFGPKPDWMDNGEKEKAVANSLKQIVKHTSRRKAVVRPPEQRGSPVRIEPKTLGVAVGAVPVSDPISLKEHGDSIRDTSTIPGSSERKDDNGYTALDLISTDDSTLLTHYIDHVLPLQYPMYQPGVAVPGRGWLLDLLLRSKPLYHAVIALAACHHRIFTLAEPSRANALIQQEENVQVCLELLNQAAQNDCRKNGLGMLAAVTQIMFFELFNHQGCAWQAHLSTAINMYRRGHSNAFAQLGLNEETRWILSADLPLSEGSAAISREAAGFRFFSGTLVWLDIVSSITAGRTPLLLSHHARILGAGSQTQLRDIMGCENWVLFQIAQICRLHEDKNRAIQKGQVDRTHFEEAATGIKLGIQFSISHISDANSPRGVAMHEDPRILITRMFAHMAAVYLHLVTYGFEKLDYVSTAFQDALAILKTQRSSRLLLVLTTPLFILGSIVKPGDQQFFRDILSSPPLLDPFLQHRMRILPILEEIWARQNTPGFTWNHCVEIAQDILLV
ncbi:uncharacterized protein K460DRAFT_405959 [Cucurbitaria berberidis CBS 394.84]|uniref:Zn(2)-C6 fungal-type domain-containing protein n=1 Tax=Cucurbitaria berberidis CBS 394.84 TaxID=1168544 RepID=A0A9P4L903_9PLEO|nr:uncharacterized protein K460DRAFT_405959 [Cucurbitaria berberidis CBS 394.84]KAF1845719.1 hypothetical protein K460DRAFT_405959 [Cucurbitaria berberidis CBS 394.84]